MMNLISSLWEFINKDLTGRELVMESRDPYFGRIVFFGRKGHKDYWEAEFAHPEQSEKFSIIIPAGRDGALEPYARLAATLLNDLGTLFTLCKPAFVSEYEKWTNEPFPSDWRGAFSLDGLTLPKEADENEEWSVCYFVQSARHYFTATFRKGEVCEVFVDG